MLRALVQRVVRSLRKPQPARRQGAVWRARGGNVAVTVGLSVPALATVVFGGVDIANVLNDRDRMTSIADAAALSGARNLSVAMQSTSAVESARAEALAMIGEWAGAPQITVEATIEQLPHDTTGIHVSLNAHRTSLFGDLLPPGGWNYTVASTATAVGSKPLCILAFDDRSNKNFAVGDDAEIRAPGCLVHSNGDLYVTGGGVIEAGQAEAVRDATGDIRPDPVTDAPVIPDPFASRAVPPGLACKGKLSTTVIMSITTGTQTLPAGSHCGVIDISGDATLVLAPGDHHFQLGSFTVRDNARLTGTDVVMIFDTTTFFKFSDQAKVDVQGRQSGVNAGFVVMASRDNDEIFKIDSTHIDRLDGVIYIPDAKLRVSGTSDVARQSDWTVIVSKQLELAGNPHLYLNTDYAGSPIKVPGGVGPRPAGARLVQ